MQNFNSRDLNKSISKSITRKIELVTTVYEILTIYFIITCTFCHRPLKITHYTFIGGEL